MAAPVTKIYSIEVDLCYRQSAPLVVRPPPLFTSSVPSAIVCSNAPARKRFFFSSCEVRKRSTRDGAQEQQGRDVEQRNGKIRSK